jgi:hypothetical protein
MNIIVMDRTAEMDSNAAILSKTLIFKYKTYRIPYQK